MESFEVAGISATHDEMVHKIEEQTAINEARMELALGNVDQQKIKIEEEAQQMQANELVKQFKAEMGLMAPEALPPGPAQKTIRWNRSPEDHVASCASTGGLAAGSSR